MKNKKVANIVFAFSLGQVTQLVLHGMVVSLNMWDSRRVIFCASAGFVILFAVIVGIVIASNKDDKDVKPETKSYLEWAEIPEDETDKVVSPFERKV